MRTRAAELGATERRRPEPLTVSDLRVAYQTQEGLSTAVRGVDFVLPAGETLGIVGETGSGKSTVAMALAGLLPSGSVLSADVLQLGSDDLRPGHDGQILLGKTIGVVFQDPQTALNPILTIGHQLTDHMEWHLGLSRAAALERAVERLAEVGIASPRDRLAAFPHEFSGGMLQRVMLAIALACDPILLIADEPTTALDATIQAQILDLVRRIQRERGLSIIWITHDLALLGELAQRIAVMYAGRVVEYGRTTDIFDDARHPYTAGLMRSIQSLWAGRDGILYSIPGAPPRALETMRGCTFRDRCPLASVRCLEVPPWERVSEIHGVECWEQGEMGSR